MPAAYALKTLRALAKAPVILAAVLSIFLAVPLHSAEPTQPPGAETPVVDTLEKLYEDYETIDKRMEDIHRSLGTMPGAKEMFTPFTVTVKKKPGFELLFLELRDNNAPVWNHIYSPVENAAIEKGGRHIFYKTDMAGGKHSLDFSYQYVPANGKTPVKSSAKWHVRVDKEPVFIEVMFERLGDEVVLKAKKLSVVEEK